MRIILDDDMSKYVSLYLNREVKEIILDSESDSLKGDFARYIKELVEERDALINVLSELETWKKIGEKLAEYIMNTDIEEDICNSIPDGKCDVRAIGECYQCIIDWARKEVENES